MISMVRSAFKTIGRKLRECGQIGVTTTASMLLARIGPPAAETIVTALHAAEGPLKASLTRALGKVGHPEAQEILKIRTRINKLISEETGQDIEKVAKDSDRNFWMNAEEAEAYGLVVKTVTSMDEINALK